MRTDVSKLQNLPKQRKRDPVAEVSQDPSLAFVAQQYQYVTEP